MQSLLGRRAAGARGSATVAPSASTPSPRPHCRHPTCRDAKEGKGGAAGGKQQSLEDVLAAANALLDNLQAGNPPSPGAMSLQGSIDELSALGYMCDESGCVLVLPGDHGSGEVTSLPFSGLLSGSSWALGLLEEVPEPEEGEEQTSYTATIRGPSWAVPLKPSELASVLTMLRQLRMMVADLGAQGQWLPAAGDRPASRVKRQSSHIELLAEHASAEPGFSIAFTFRSNRRSVTTSWPADVTAAVIVAVDKAMGATGPDSTGRLERVSATTTATVSA